MDEEAEPTSGEPMTSPIVPPRRRGPMAARWVALARFGEGRGGGVSGCLGARTVCWKRGERGASPRGAGAARRRGDEVVCMLFLCPEGRDVTPSKACGSHVREARIWKEGRDEGGEAKGTYTVGPSPVRCHYVQDITGPRREYTGPSRNNLPPSPGR